MSDRPSFLTSFAAVTFARLSIKLAGFRRTTRLARWLGARIAGRLERGEPVEIARRIALAAAFFPGRAVCLEQSVALYLVLRRYGHSGALRVGVQPYPFQAHAWIEIDGAPVFENEDHLTKFVPFPEVFA